MPDVPWLVYAFPLAIVGLIAVAALRKYFQVRDAAHWPQVAGKIVTSSTQARNVKTFEDDLADQQSEQQRNFANVVYEYVVNGQTLTNDRVSIGEDPGDSEVADQVARYPVGKVVAVYYNPRNPKEAVLERDVPKKLWRYAIAMVVGGVVLIFGSFFGFNQLAQFARAHMQNPDRAPLMIALGAMGLVTAWFGYAFRKQATQAASWPLVTARIETSQVDQFEGRLSSDDDDDDNRDRIQTLYRPMISCSYEYGGLKYAGDQASLGGKVTSNSDGIAKKMIAKYPVGSTFSVHVNPANASQSVLNPSGAGAWFIWTASLVLLGLAYFISQQP